MTPAARVQTAIELLDGILEGAPAERSLTHWARASRFAGSKDRAAIRDHVYDVLRQRNTLAALGGGTTGRALMIGLLRQQGIAPETVFTGEGYAPAALSDDETPSADIRETVDMPAWLIPPMQAALGDDFAAIEQALRTRAPVIARANLRRGDRDAALAALADEGIIGQAHPASETAIEITTGMRKVKNSAAFLAGVIEMQDASSQAAIDLLPLKDDMRVLDYCAGGGGKLLAMAGRSQAAFFAHDAIQSRMRDLPNRARRAAVNTTTLAPDELAENAPFDLVFCDVPCSGSGTWRRDPDAKWRFTAEDLTAITTLQAEILTKAAQLVAPGGALAYATCSFLSEENADQIAAFQATHPGWQLEYQQSWTPLDGCDGFFTALLRSPA